MSEADHCEIEWAREEGETVWPQRFADLLECYLHPCNFITSDGVEFHTIIQIKNILELTVQTTQQELRLLEQILTKKFQGKGFREVTIEPVYKIRGVSYLAALEIKLIKN